MKKITRSIFASTLLFSIVMCATFSSASASSTESNTPDTIYGSDVILDLSLDEFSTVKRGSDVCLDITLEGLQKDEEIIPFGNVDQTTTTSFSFDLLDRNGEYVTSTVVTVTGVFSQIEHAAAISKVTATFSGGKADRISYKPDIDGDTVTVTFYYTAGVTFPIGSTGFKISTNGNITQI